MERGKGAILNTEGNLALSYFWGLGKSANNETEIYNLIIGPNLTK